MSKTYTILKEAWDAKLDKIDQLQQECDELRQTITHLENGWKIDGDSFEECQIENARLRVLIHDKDAAIGEVIDMIVNGEHASDCMEQLARIAAMTTEDTPTHKCQNNIDADTGECAVCGAVCADDLWMNAPMGSPDEPVTPPDWRGESCHNQWDAPSDEVMRVSPRNPEVAVVVNAHADDIEKMQHELEVGRANDWYFNEKLDYIGEMKEEIQQQIDSHTTIVHGEIERRLSEMGQQINTLETKSDAMRLDIISPRQINPKLDRLQQQIDSLKHGCTLADALRQSIDDIARLEERIIELEQRITPEEEVPKDMGVEGDYPVLSAAYDRINYILAQLRRQKGESE